MRTVRKTLLTLLLSAAAATIGCSSNSSSDSPITELPANVIRTQWTRTLDMHGAAPKCMFVRGDSLFVFRSDNLLYRLDRKSGDVKFVANAAGEHDKVGAPVLLDGKMIVPADTKLHVLDERGFRVSTVEIGQPMRSGVVGDDQGIYVGIDAERSFGRIACIELDRPDAPFRWQLLTGGTVVSTPALHKGVLYAGSDDGKVYAVDSDRTAVWPIQFFQTAAAFTRIFPRMIQACTSLRPTESSTASALAMAGSAGSTSAAHRCSTRPPSARPQSM